MVISHMAKGDFAEVQRKPEATASELKNSSDPERRRILLREMNRLVAEAERISSQPPKMNHGPMNHGPTGIAKPQGIAD